jgi:hypothetical protein
LPIQEGYFIIFVSDIRNENEVRAFETRVFIRILVPKADEVTEGWRELHNKLHNVYFSPN